LRIIILNQKFTEITRALIENIFDMFLIKALVFLSRLNKNAIKRVLKKFGRLYFIRKLNLFFFHLNIEILAKLFNLIVPNPNPYPNHKPT